MRFFCWGRVVEWDEGEFGRVVGRMGKEAVKGARAVVVLDVWKVRWGRRGDFVNFSVR